MSQRESAGTGARGKQAGGDFPPAASAVLAVAQQTVEEKKDVLLFKEVDAVDARERSDKPVRERMADWLNEAVGENRFIGNASMHGWNRKHGSASMRFAVTRFYFHKRVAVDFPRSHQDVKVIEQKRDCLRLLGIVYVAIMPNESLLIEQVMERIDTEREAMLKQVPKSVMRKIERGVQVGA